jgi:hypothetical protein
LLKTFINKVIIQRRPFSLFALLWCVTDVYAENTPVSVSVVSNDSGSDATTAILVAKQLLSVG